ncbi:hypothetical protein PHLCEN_2v7601 [Hermanssonia centrifuga]|uniref:Uncharacterized protein n=1 Tax=Hermanssonia centrifuga TaxID=98765 RepID=A0A2R6NW41_9APHY|nr:hypothetical protein PHLCEN_2v7601 [Hermanssonia centrifuga]
MAQDVGSKFAPLSDKIKLFRMDPILSYYALGFKGTKPNHSFEDEGDPCGDLGDDVEPLLEVN